MRIFKRTLAVILSMIMILCIVPFAGNAASKPTFSLNVVSETDSEVVLSINLESGTFENGKFQLVYNDKISGCSKISKTEFFNEIISDAEARSEIVTFVSNPYYALCSVAGTAELNTPGAYFEMTLNKKSPIRVVSKDIALEVDDIEANVVNKIPDISVIEKTVTYNYSENGGTSATKTTAKTAEGEKIDLTPIAIKSGWQFVGWNTDPNATTKLSSLVMGKDDVTLYAVYKKTLTATFIDYSVLTKKTRTSNVTIFNNETSGVVTPPTQNDYSGWTKYGWAADGSSYEAVSSFEISASTVFYGLYKRNITLSYDANGGSTTPPAQKGEQFLNSSDKSAYKNPTLTLAGATERNDYYFAGWAKGSKSGQLYNAGSEITIDGDTKMYASWRQRERVNSVSVDDIKVSFKKSAQINYKVNADDGVTCTISWESSNPAVATVDKNGVVYAVKKGTAKITCTVTDQYGHKVSDTCNAEVYIKDDLGDVNEDGVINSADALMVLNYNVKKIDLTRNQKKFADVNKDGRVDSVDALQILRFVVGDITEF